MPFTTAPDFSDGILTPARLQQLADAINERTPIHVSDVLTTPSAAFTTVETQIHSVTASLISGLKYAVVMYTGITSTVAGDNVDAKIREDTLAGTQMQTVRKDLLATNITELILVYAEYTAVSTASKTFVGTAVRQAGTGNLTVNCGAQFPSYMYIELISG